MVSRPVPRSTQSGSSSKDCNSNVELQSFERSNLTNSVIINSLQQCNMPLSSSSSASNVKNQIFIKIIMMKNDGTHLKTKGMPFERFTAVFSAESYCVLLPKFPLYCCMGHYHI